MGRGGWRGGWEDKKTEMRKERLKRGVSGEMEWYVARHRPIRRHWERTATDKRRTIGRKKSRNQKDMPGAFIKDNVVLSLNRAYMLRGVRYKPHLSFFQPFKYESACECVCAFTCLWVIVASGVVVSMVGITLNLCRQLRKKYKHKCVCMYTACTVYTVCMYCIYAAAAAAAELVASVYSEDVQGRDTASLSMSVFSPTRGEDDKGTSRPSYAFANLGKKLQLAH